MLNHCLLFQIGDRRGFANKMHLQERQVKTLIFKDLDACCIQVFCNDFVRDRVVQHEQYFMWEFA